MARLKFKKAPPNPMQTPEVPGNSSRCKATKQNGKRCKGWARYGGFCHIHDPGGRYQNTGRLTKRKDKVVYKDYLYTDHWLKKKKSALEYFGYRCCECGAENVRLDVHHTHYRDMWKEKLEDLRVLCRECHQLKHGG